MKLGARILKTGVAIVFALFLADLLHLPSPVFAGIAAIFALQPSIYRSYLTIIEQIQSNLIGAIVAVLFATIFGHNYVAIGLAAVITIAIMLKLKLEKSVSLALVTIIAIMEIQGDNFQEFSLLRFATIVVGVLAAFLVNLIFMPPKYETRLYQTIQLTQDELIRWTRLAARQASDHQATKQTLELIRDKLVKLDQIYLFYKEERNYLTREKRSKARKLVVYRQMIAVTNKSWDLLKRFHLHENELSHLPPDFREMLQSRVDGLLAYNEQLLLKYTGKLKPEHTGVTSESSRLNKQEVMDFFAKKLTEKSSEDSLGSYHLLHLISSILDYEEQLEHLDTLIVSHQNYHGEEIQLKLEDTF
ncbi:aromatic acid exporter family protein [Paenisporosarcina cavernae]|uniref:Aromatic acid exporter family protein n=1 Tax=Paenisporosarcina cavernae TaxID=2320858 RepID=A0A385YUS3_9BACL|nr:aromatic acid exporter family protein [Paenisporosarcina cavernae]AYC30221.1 aromatic acid exporter family protein [Paenisporosarcina cavernae]